MPEPRDPLLKVLIHFKLTQTSWLKAGLVSVPRTGGPRPGGRRAAARRGNEFATTKGWEFGPGVPILFNDPSAGSPTETLLRLLLPLNDQV